LTRTTAGVGVGAGGGAAARTDVGVAVACGRAKRVLKVKAVSRKSSPRAPPTRASSPARAGRRSGGKRLAERRPGRREVENRPGRRGSQRSNSTRLQASSLRLTTCRSFSPLRFGFVHQPSERTGERWKWRQVPHSRRTAMACPFSTPADCRAEQTGGATGCPSDCPVTPGTRRFSAIRGEVVDTAVPPD